jgi:hypothetical protein
MQDGDHEKCELNSSERPVLQEELTRILKTNLKLPELLFFFRQLSLRVLVAKVQSFCKLNRVEREVIALVINQKRVDKSRGSR